LLEKIPSVQLQRKKKNYYVCKIADFPVKYSSPNISHGLSEWPHNMIFYVLSSWN